MLPNLDVDLLKTFAVLAETGNFTRTAEEVGRTQSAVSMQVKRLEELVGKPLLTREGRSNTLTSDGQMLLDYARRIDTAQRRGDDGFHTPRSVGPCPLRHAGRLCRPHPAGRNPPGSPAPIARSRWTWIASQAAR